MRVNSSEIHSWASARDRVAVREELKRLEATFPKIRKTISYRIFDGRKVDGEYAFPNIYEFLDQIDELRSDYNKLKPRDFSSLTFASNKDRGKHHRFLVKLLEGGGTLLNLIVRDLLDQMSLHLKMTMNRDPLLDEISTEHPIIALLAQETKKRNSAKVAMSRRGQGG